MTLQQLRVADAATVTRVLVEGGADLVAAPTLTPWLSLNARLDAPAGLQLTVFQELGETGAPDTIVGRPWSGWASEVWAP